jgi:hypothetical protein
MMTPNRRKNRKWSIRRAIFSHTLCAFPFADATLCCAAEFGLREEMNNEGEEKDVP